MFISINCPKPQIHVAITLIIGFSIAPVLKLITVAVIITVAIPLNDRLNPNGDGCYSERVSSVGCKPNTN